MSTLAVVVLNERATQVLTGDEKKKIGVISIARHEHNTLAFNHVST